MTGATWCVVMANLRSEEIAAAAIERRGLTVFLPTYRRRLAGVRLGAFGQRIRTRGAGTIVRRALFPPYLLVQLDGDRAIRAIMTAAGVARILRRAAGEPRLLQAGIVDELRCRCEAGEFDQVGPDIPGKVAKRLDIVPGDAVAVIRGDLSGLAATLVDLDDAGRGHVLLEILGRPVRTQVPQDSLAAVA